ncbi:LytR/AlgR family response regulator transcription factor [Flavobacterium sp.]|uniref:LytR/AlgR family response regulator transcription factor n=1 Tax=Flavobacterium sp. TaxID=239 RepID=UPI00375183C4
MENIQKIKCLIVDDEPIARKIIKNYIDQISFLENAGECKNGLEALDVITKDKEIQIVFLDINMPNLNGLSMAKIMKNNIPIIFTTAYSEYAVESYDVNAIDYLLKPFSFERFTTAVFKAIEKIEKAKDFPNTAILELEENKIYIKSEGMNFPVLLTDILYCEAMKNYTKVFISNGKSLKTLIPFSKIEQDLIYKGNHFLRIHRSFLISKLHISSIKSNHINIGNFEIPIGPQYKESILKTIGLK